MDPSEVRMTNGDIWKVTYDATTERHTIAITTTASDTRRITMTTDDLERFEDALKSTLESYEAGSPEPRMVVTDDAVISMEVRVREWPDGDA
jgi:hypothetical protein